MRKGKLHARPILRSFVRSEGECSEYLTNMSNRQASFYGHVLSFQHISREFEARVFSPPTSSNSFCVEKSGASALLREVRDARDEKKNRRKPRDFFCGASTFSKVHTHLHSPSSGLRTKKRAHTPTCVACRKEREFTARALHS